MPQNLGTVAIYDIWDCVRTRVHSTGIAMMPLAGIPPQQSIPIVMDGGSDCEVIEFIAQRRGAPPIVPSPTTTNPNRILLGGAQSAPFTVVDGGAIQTYVVAGCYVFGILDPEGLIGNFMLGAAPMPYQPQAYSEYIPAANFQAGMVNDTPPSEIPDDNNTGVEMRMAINGGNG